MTLSSTVMKSMAPIKITTIILFREDYEAASNLDTGNRQEFYINTKSGAESGWDFSSRWYIVDDGTNDGNLSHINTRYVIPVDLNSFVCMNNYLLSEMFLLIGNKEKANFYREKFLSWREAIKEVHFMLCITPEAIFTLFNQLVSIDI